ncbi:hypothetical protein DPV78_004248 [Talaromyces pinophilus]|nr:hypothetical protein DPV78_004248 [Talaromyces pinophilus]
MQNQEMLDIQTQFTSPDPPTLTSVLVSVDTALASSLVTFLVSWNTIQPAIPATQQARATNSPVVQLGRLNLFIPHIQPAKHPWNMVFHMLHQTTKSNFHDGVADTRAPLGERFGAFVKADSVRWQSTPSTQQTHDATMGKRYHAWWMLAKRVIPARLFWWFPSRQWNHQYESLNLHGASPNPVTQNSPFRI